jgi:hypothetical protein
MSVTFDPANRRIVLNAGVTSITTQFLYSRWKEWAQDNAQWPEAFRVVGGDPIGGGLFVASYFFLMNSWRVRPQEADHTLTIDGNLTVDGGGEPVVQTLGSFRVLTRLVVPVQAQGISTSGSTGPTAAEIAAALLAAMNSAPPGVDVKQMNGADVIGTGTSGDPWRGVGVPP